MSLQINLFTSLLDLASCNEHGKSLSIVSDIDKHIVGRIILSHFQQPSFTQSQLPDTNLQKNAPKGFNHVNNTVTSEKPHVPVVDRKRLMDDVFLMNDKLVNVAKRSCSPGSINPLFSTLSHVEKQKFHAKPEDQPVFSSYSSKSLSERTPNGSNNLNNFHHGQIIQQSKSKRPLPKLSETVISKLDDTPVPESPQPAVSKLDTPVAKLPESVLPKFGTSLAVSVLDEAAVSKRGEEAVSKHPESAVHTFQELTASCPKKTTVSNVKKGSPKIPKTRKKSEASLVSKTENPLSVFLSTGKLSESSQSLSVLSNNQSAVLRGQDSSVFNVLEEQTTSKLKISSGSKFQDYSLPKLPEPSVPKVKESTIFKHLSVSSSPVASSLRDLSNSTIKESPLRVNFLPSGPAPPVSEFEESMATKLKKAAVSKFQERSCAQCKKFFSSSALLQTHSCSSYVCPDCHMSFAQPIELAQHRVGCRLRFLQCTYTKNSKQLVNITNSNKNTEFLEKVEELSSKKCEQPVLENNKSDEENKNKAVEQTNKTEREKIEEIVEKLSESLEMELDDYDNSFSETASKSSNVATLFDLRCEHCLTGFESASGYKRHKRGNYCKDNKNDQSSTIAVDETLFPDESAGKLLDHDHVISNDQTQTCSEVKTQLSSHHAPVNSAGEVEVPSGTCQVPNNLSDKINSPLISSNSSTLLRSADNASDDSITQNAVNPVFTEASSNDRILVTAHTKHSRRDATSFEKPITRSCSRSTPNLSDTVGVKDRCTETGQLSKKVPNTIPWTLDARTQLLLKRGRPLLTSVSKKDEIVRRAKRKSGLTDNKCNANKDLFKRMKETNSFSSPVKSNGRSSSNRIKLKETALLSPRKPQEKDLLDFREQKNTALSPDEPKDMFLDSVKTKEIPLPSSIEPKVTTFSSFLKSEETTLLGLSKPKETFSISVKPKQIPLISVTKPNEALQECKESVPLIASAKAGSSSFSLGENSISEKRDIRGRHTKRRISQSQSKRQKSLITPGYCDTTPSNIVEYRRRSMKHLKFTSKSHDNVPKISFKRSTQCLQIRVPTGGNLKRPKRSKTVHAIQAASVVAQSNFVNKSFDSNVSVDSGINIGSPPSPPVSPKAAATTRSRNNSVPKSDSMKCSTVSQKIAVATSSVVDENVLKLPSESMPISPLKVQEFESSDDLSKTELVVLIERDAMIDKLPGVSADHRSEFTPDVQTMPNRTVNSTDLHPESRFEAVADSINAYADNYATSLTYSEDVALSKIAMEVSEECSTLASDVLPEFKNNKILESANDETSTGETEKIFELHNKACVESASNEIAIPVVGHITESTNEVSEKSTSGDHCELKSSESVALATGSLLALGFNGVAESRAKPQLGNVPKSASDNSLKPTYSTLSNSAVVSTSDTDGIRKSDETCESEILSVSTGEHIEMTKEVLAKTTSGECLNSETEKFSLNSAIEEFSGLTSEGGINAASEEAHQFVPDEFSQLNSVKNCNLETGGSRSSATDDEITVNPESVHLCEPKGEMMPSPTSEVFDYTEAKEVFSSKPEKSASSATAAVSSSQVDDSFEPSNEGWLKPSSEMRANLVNADEVSDSANEDFVDSATMKTIECATDNVLEPELLLPNGKVFESVFEGLPNFVEEKLPVESEEFNASPKQNIFGLTTENHAKSDFEERFELSCKGIFDPAPEKLSDSTSEKDEFKSAPDEFKKSETDPRLEPATKEHSGSNDISASDDMFLELAREEFLESPSKMAELKDSVISHTVESDELRTLPTTSTDYELPEVPEDGVSEKESTHHKLVFTKDQNFLLQVADEHQKSDNHSVFESTEDLVLEVPSGFVDEVPQSADHKTSISLSQESFNDQPVVVKLPVTQAMKDDITEILPDSASSTEIATIKSASTKINDFDNCVGKPQESSLNLREVPIQNQSGTDQSLESSCYIVSNSLVSRNEKREAFETGCTDSAQTNEVVTKSQLSQPLLTHQTIQSDDLDEIFNESFNEFISSFACSTPNSDNESTVPAISPVHSESFLELFTRAEIQSPLLSERSMLTVMNENDSFSTTDREKIDGIVDIITKISSNPVSNLPPTSSACSEFQSNSERVSAETALPDNAPTSAPRKATSTSLDTELAGVSLCALSEVSILEMPSEVGSSFGRFLADNTISIEEVVQLSSDDPES